MATDGGMEDGVMDDIPIGYLITVFAGMTRKGGFRGAHQFFLINFCLLIYSVVFEGGRLFDVHFYMRVSQ